jgi:hypothetical protein
MSTDSLTKALARQKFNIFVRYLGLMDIKNLFENEVAEDCDGDSESDYDSDYKMDSTDGH